MELSGLKVKIGIDGKGYAKYPDFNQLPCVQTAGLDWSRYVDVHGLGWHYDKTSGHKDNTDDSPFGQQWGVLIVPEKFVDQAVTQFPAECEKIDETELEDFYNNRAHAHEPDEIIDKDVLDGIKAKQDVGAELTTNQQKALDPNDETPGIRKNPNRYWADMKAKKRLTITDKTVKAINLDIQK